jgi:FKBP-type peptidyl-prolyl cis-trans isomerase
MRIRLVGTLLVAPLALAACSGGGGSVRLDTDDQKASYALGQDLGRNLGGSGARIDTDALLAGFADALAEIDPQLPVAEQQQALMAFGQSVQEERQREAQEIAETNAAEGQAYLEQNGAREGVVTTETGLQFEVLTAGEGPTPTDDDRVTLHYTGTLVDGTQFDSSLDDDPETEDAPAVFPVGGVIPGFTEALKMMSVGGTYRIVIPGDLAYGPQGAGGAIGPNATLIFEVELLGIESGQ